MVFSRHPGNPLITPHDVVPSHPDFEIIGTFNAGVTVWSGEVILLLRVAERPVQTDPSRIFYPQMTADGQISVEHISRKDERFDTRDARVIRDLETGGTVLTSVSHLRLARSQDGVHFTIDTVPWLRAEPPYENFGVEDARISQIDGTYYVNYSAVSGFGIATGLVKTKDFITVERCGIILPPSNRDVTLFPERVNEEYVCYHRPMPSPFGGLNIWLSTSPDLIHWGAHRIVLQAERVGWEAGRVGGGAPPLRTEKGWLSIYHAADPQDRYCLGAFLTPLDEPDRIIAVSREPLLKPEAAYETQGFFRNVVFTCGAILQEGIVRLYYGASDEVIALAEAPLTDVLAFR